MGQNRERQQAGICQNRERQQAGICQNRERQQAGICQNRLRKRAGSGKVEGPRMKTGERNEDTHR